jgi:hypothetical protein
VVFTGKDLTANPRTRLFHLNRSLTVQTLAVLPTYFWFVPTCVVDQRGDLILLNDSSTASQGGIYRLPRGSSSVTTILTGLTNAAGMTEDQRTGDFLVGTAAGDVHRVTPSGTIVSVRRGVLPLRVSMRGKLDADPSSNTAFAAWQFPAVLRYDAATGAVSTLTSTPGLVAGLDYNPVHRDLYATLNVDLRRIDIATGRTVVLEQYWNYYSLFPSDVVTWGSQMLTGEGVPKPGATYRVHLVIPGEAGRPYLAGAALGTSPGISTSSGRIPLNSDPLLALSLSHPTSFHGFSGLLDAGGAAQLRITLPAAAVLRGARFFLAAFTYDIKGIRRITEPMGVNVE